MKSKINHAPSFVKVEGAVWLQGVGHTYGKAASELKPGDLTVWNYGGIEKVVGIEKETAKTITVLFTSEKVTTPTPRRMKKDRIVGIAYA